MSTQRIHITGYIHTDTAAAKSRSSIRAALDAVVRSVRKMLAGLIRERALRRAEHELMALDDRMLRDIGLSRGEIASAVRNPAEERLNGVRHPTSYPF